jgi:hypothetical protein
MSHGTRTKPKGMTPGQQKYLAKLLKLVGEPWDPTLSCVQAARRIDELRARLGFDGRS